MTGAFQKHLEATRNNLWNEAKALLDHAGTQNRELTGAESEQYDRINTELDSIIERQKLERDREARQAATDKVLDQILGTEQRGHDAEPALNQQFRNAILNHDRTPIMVSGAGARSGHQPGLEARALATTTGGGLVPSSFWNQIQRHLVEGSAVLGAGATLITTESGEPLRVPRSSANSAATIVAEGTTIPASDPTLGTVPLPVWKYAFRVIVNRELAEDSSFDVAGYVAAQAGEALANGPGGHFVSGTGTDQPLGIAVAATAGVTGAAGTAGVFDQDDLIDLYHSVPEPYARSASAAWVMRNTTLGMVRKLRDTEGRPLFDINAPAGSGASGTLLGRPVFVDPNMAEVSAGTKSILFGDMSKYWVRQVKGMRIDSSDQVGFNEDQTVFRATWRTGGTMIDPNGIKAFVGGTA